MVNAIGGFFEEEEMILKDKSTEYHSIPIRLSSGRAAFELALNKLEVECIYMPYYICETIFQPISRMGITVHRYQIDESFKLKDKIDLRKGEYLLYVNYFGIMDHYATLLSEKYGDRLILDNCQAFFSSPISAGTAFYSVRKFFGVPDGAYLAGDNIKLSQMSQYKRRKTTTVHLKKRNELGPEKAYNDYLFNEQSFNNAPVQRMSVYTENILQRIDYKAACNIRRENYLTLNENLEDKNRNRNRLEDESVPLCYPFWTKNGDGLREFLISERVYVPKYWPGVVNNFNKDYLELDIVNNLVPLPIDHRYTYSEMNRVVTLVKSFINE